MAQMVNTQSILPIHNPSNSSVRHKIPLRFHLTLVLTPTIGARGAIFKAGTKVCSNYLH